MADRYWNQQQHPRDVPPKRPRYEFETQPSAKMHGGYFPQNQDLDFPDTITIGSAYDRYLQNMQTEADSPNGVTMGRPGGNSKSTGEFIMRHDGVHRPNHSAISFDPPETFGTRNREPLSLPQDASNTLYVEGLPYNCSKREVAHIFRPFVGYIEVRLVTKDSKHNKFCNDKTTKMIKLLVTDRIPLEFKTLGLNSFPPLVDC